MSYQIISGDYISSIWYQFLMNPIFEPKKTSNQRYESLGTFSQGTNWEKVFALGNTINRKLKMTEQEIISEVSNLKKGRRS